jgi:hypothetical protein
MKRFLLVAAALVISTSAFAGAGSPVRQGNKCWAETDRQRGFGFWDQCADRAEIARRAIIEGRQGRFDEAVTISADALANAGGGGGGGGAGGGGNR